MDQEIVIKPYEPIDDEAMKNMCIRNMFHTQRLTRGALIQWTIGAYGLSKIILRLSIVHIALSVFFQLFGLDLLKAALASFASIILILAILYGIVLPNNMKKIGKYYTDIEVAQDFVNIKEKFMGEKKCFWIATQKVSTPTPKERIVGCVLAEPYNWEKDEMKLASRRKEMGEVAELRRMSVAQDLRGKGIGMRLGLELKRFCKEKGYNYVVLGTLANNYSAITLYKKIGFELTRYSYFFLGRMMPFCGAQMVLKL